MTQPGETTGYTQGDHVKALEAHRTRHDRPLVQYVVANQSDFGTQVITRYHQSGSAPVKVGDKLAGYEYLVGDYAVQDLGRVRHDADSLAKKIFELYIG